MTQSEINQGIEYLKSQIKKLGRLPNEILMRANAFTEDICNELRWSHKDSQFFLGLLLSNHYLELNGSMFLVLTEDGYIGLNENIILL